MRYLTVQQARSALDSIQRKTMVPARLLSDPVTVRPMPENAFLISGVPADGPSDAGFRILADVGASLSRDEKTDAYDAVVTWDTMLHRLVVEQLLTFPETKTA